MNDHLPAQPIPPADSTSESRPDISLKDAFDIYQKQSDSVHKLWGYFQIVSIAVLGYTVGSDKGQWSQTTYIIIAASYVFFACCNQWVVVLSQKELNRFASAVHESAEAAGPIGEKLSVKAVKPSRVRMFHTISSIVVLAAIWVTWHDKCESLPSCRGEQVELSK